MRMTPGPVAIAIIKHYEKLRLEVYPDDAGHLTVGWGHKLTALELRQFDIGDQIAADQADCYLGNDLRRTSRGIQRHLDRPLALNQIEFDSCVSLAFNIGVTAFGERSSVCKSINRGDVAGAVYHFGAWRRAGGLLLRGLVRRRAVEAMLYAHAHLGERWALDFIESLP